MTIRGNCTVCGGNFKRRYAKNSVPIVKLCSNKCRREWLQKDKVKKECIVCNKVFSVSASVAYRYVTCSIECKRKHKEGDKNGNWRGGIAGNRKKEIRSGKLRRWRKAVFERDGPHCVLCGSSDGLEADRIKPWSLYPEFRYEVSNGRILCKICHNKHTRELAAERKRLEALGYVRITCPREYEILVCPRCGVSFLNKSGQSIYCGKRCQRAEGQKRLRVAKAARGECKCCSNPVAPNYSRCIRCLEKQRVEMAEYRKPDV
jgi:hypothetical protein